MVEALTIAALVLAVVREAIRLVTAILEKKNRHSN